MEPSHREGGRIPDVVQPGRADQRVIRDSDRWRDLRSTSGNALDMTPSLWKINGKMASRQTASLIGIHDQPAYGCESSARAQAAQRTSIAGSTLDTPGPICL